MNTLHGLLLFSFLITAAAGQTAQPTTAHKIIFLHCGFLLDGKSERAQKNVFLEIDGDKISAVPAAVPGGASVIDLSGETCLPGLIDTHTHVLLQGDITAEDYDTARPRNTSRETTRLAARPEAEAGGGDCGRRGGH